MRLTRGTAVAAAAVAAALSFAVANGHHGQPAAGPAALPPAPATRDLPPPASVTSPTTTTTPRSRPPAPRPAPRPARTTTSARTSPDPATIATRWVAASCNYTWRDTWQQHAAAQAVYTTPAFRAVLQAGGPAAWRRDVTDRHLVASCTITGAATITAAPNSPTRAYIRVTVNQTLAPDGTRATPAATSYPLRLTRVAAGWLVDGYAVGG